MELSAIIGSGSIANIIGVVAVIITILIYWHQQTSSRKGSVIRSCDSLISELDENYDALTGNKRYERIEYNYKNNSINYTNVKLGHEGYQSILSSGLFTLLQEITQIKLTNLYARIKSYNAIIDELFSLNNQYTLYKDEIPQDNWFNTRLNCDLYLTRHKIEIIELLDKAKILVAEEKKRNLSYLGKK